MSQSTRFGIVSALAVAAAFLFSACGGGGGDGGSSGQNEVWDLTFNTTTPQGQPDTINLNQSGDSISGSTTAGGQVTGIADGNNCTITVVYVNNYYITMNLTINVTVITGTYIDSEGHTGSVNANPGGGNPSTVDVTGTWTSPNGYGGTDTLVLQQNGNTITGTATFQKDNGQYETTSLTNGSLSGNVVTGTITWSDGWTGTATMTVNGNSMTGTNFGVTRTWTRQ